MSKPNLNPITKETYLFWYEQMLLMRRFEEKAGQLYGEQKIRGFCHLYIGEEAVLAGTMSILRPEDAIITAYRDHAHALAKGVSANAVMAELFAKVTGCSKGKGGSMHMFSKEHHFYGGHGIVGGQIPLGAGVAFAEKYKGTDNVCVCFIGDGAMRQGAVNETFNMAMLWKLPIIFVCENNGYAMGTSVKRTSNVEDIYKIGLGFDMPSVPVNGMEPEPMHEAMSIAVERARKGEGPSFIEAKTYRYKGHSMSDPQKYRTKEELKKYQSQDPLDHVKQVIEKKKYATQEWFGEIEQRVRAIVNESVTFSENSPYPDPSELYMDVYAEPNYPFIRD